jgi:hypothetical protein
MPPLPLLFVVLAAVLLVVFLAMRARRGPSTLEVDPAEGALDAWVRGQLAPMLAEKSPDTLDKTRVAQALRGDPEPDVVSALEDQVKEIELEFLKDAMGSGAEVVLRVRFEDGTEKTARAQRSASELPARVREDFEKKALTRSRAIWGFPWVRAVGGSAFL